MKEEDVIRLVINEIRLAERKHKYWPDDIIHAAAIVSEESGELIRAAVQCELDDGPIDEVRKEAIQTAATCIRLIKNI